MCAYLSMKVHYETLIHLVQVGTTVTLLFSDCHSLSLSEFQLWDESALSRARRPLHYEIVDDTMECAKMNEISQSAHNVPRVMHCPLCQPSNRVRVPAKAGSDWRESRAIKGDSLRLRKSSTITVFMQSEGNHGRERRRSPVHRARKIRLSETKEMRAVRRSSPANLICEKQARGRRYVASPTRREKEACPCPRLRAIWACIWKKRSRRSTTTKRSVPVFILRARGTTERRVKGS